METNLPRGYNPCVVCGEVHRVAKGHVCSVCIGKIRAYDALVADHDRGLVSIEIDASPNVHGAFSSVRGSAAERLESLLRELRDAASPPTVEHVQIPAPPHEPQRTGYRRMPQTYLNVPAGLAKFFLDLEPLINMAIDEAEARGKREGTNILASLAAGELTNADFERKAGIRHKGEGA
ncbi:MAG TPA: hypothetical protein VFQ88_07770 [Nevskiaceae bacterium]|nr:hypothetical protein [Nevskiaceae bacterium]